MTGRLIGVDRGLAQVVVIASLLAAIVVVPWPLASWLAKADWPGPGSLAHAVADALALDWRSGVVPGGAGSALDGPTRFWQVFHLVKALLSIGLLAAGIRALMRSWTLSAVSGSAAGRLARWVGSLAALACAGVALLLTVANLQGVIAPLTSVLGFLPDAGPSASTGAVAIRGALAGTPVPASEAIVTDFARYHLALAVIGMLAALAVAGLAVRAWLCHRTVECVVLGLAVASIGVVVAANIGTGLDPVPALDAFLAGVPTR